MKTLDLNKISLPELIRIQKELPKAILKARKKEKKELRRKIEELAAQSGFELDELLDRKPQKKRGKVKPKYKNPDDEKQMWTGRGRKPLWVVRYLDEGGLLEDLLI